MLTAMAMGFPSAMTTGRKPTWRTLRSNCKCGGSHLVQLRIPLLFILRDPFEKADETSNTYHARMIDHADVSDFRWQSHDLPYGIQSFQSIE